MAEAATMSVAYAYITPMVTAPGDVSFYKSKRYTPSQLREYVARVCERAQLSGTEILQFHFYDGDKEIEVKH